MAKNAFLFQVEILVFRRCKTVSHRVYKAPLITVLLKAEPPSPEVCEHCEMWNPSWFVRVANLYDSN